MKKTGFLIGLNKEKKLQIVELKNGKGRKYKVTRRMPKMSVSETKVFKTREEAIKQLQEWLS